MAGKLKRARGDARGRVTPGVTHEGVYIVNRPKLRLEGHTYERGDELPAAVLARCRNASALLSRSWVLPVTEIHAARHFTGKTINHLTPTPRTLHHSERRAHLEG